METFSTEISNPKSTQIVDKLQNFNVESQNTHNISQETQQNTDNQLSCDNSCIRNSTSKKNRLDLPIKEEENEDSPQNSIQQSSNVHNICLGSKTSNFQMFSKKQITPSSDDPIKSKIKQDHILSKDDLSSDPSKNIDHHMYLNSSKSEESTKKLYTNENYLSHISSKIDSKKAPSGSILTSPKIELNSNNNFLIQTETNSNLQQPSIAKLDSQGNTIINNNVNLCNQLNYENIHTQNNDYLQTNTRSQAPIIDNSKNKFQQHQTIPSESQTSHNFLQKNNFNIQNNCNNLNSPNSIKSNYTLGNTENNTYSTNPYVFSSKPVQSNHLNSEVINNIGNNKTSSLLQNNPFLIACGVTKNEFNLFNNEKTNNNNFDNPFLKPSLSNNNIQGNSGATNLFKPNNQNVNNLNSFNSNNNTSNNFGNNISVPHQNYPEMLIDRDHGRTGNLLNYSYNNNIQNNYQNSIQPTHKQNQIYNANTNFNTNYNPSNNNFCKPENQQTKLNNDTFNTNSINHNSNPTNAININVHPFGQNKNPSNPFLNNGNSVDSNNNPFSNGNFIQNIVPPNNNPFLPFSKTNNKNSNNNQGGLNLFKEHEPIYKRKR